MSASRAPAAPPAGTPVEAAGSPAESCVSCGRPAGTPYCPHCGERRAADRHYSLLHFVRDAAGALTNTDGKLLRTVDTLVRRPGELTAAFMRGERRRYLRPLQLFLVLNLVFFLFASSSNAFSTPLRMHMTAVPHREMATRIVNERLTARRITLDEYRVAFDRATATQAKSLVIIMVPLFAAVVRLVTLRRRGYAVQDLVFSLHAFSMLLLVILAAALVIEIPLAYWASAGGPRLGWQARDLILTAAIGLAFASYNTLALRRAYGDGPIAAVAKSIALWVGLAVVLFAYRFVLFFTALWAT